MYTSDKLPARSNHPIASQMSGRSFNEQVSYSCEACETVNLFISKLKPYGLELVIVRIDCEIVTSQGALLFCGRDVCDSVFNVG